MKSMVTFMFDLLTCDRRQHALNMLVIVQVESLCVQDTENAFVLILSVNTRNSAVTTFQVLKEIDQQLTSHLFDAQWRHFLSIQQ